MLDLEFMRLALATGAVVGLLAPAVGFFLVERKASLIGDGLGHVAFAGVAFGYLLGISPVLTALVATVVGALTIEWLRTRGGAAGDQALALVFYTGIAAGVVLVSSAGALNVNLFQFLFGSILTVTRNDLWTVLVLGIGALATIAVLFRGLVADGARRGGQPGCRRSRDATERRRCGARRAHRCRLDADRRHPADRGADGAARDRRQPGRLEPAVDLRAVDGFWARLRRLRPLHRVLRRHAAGRHDRPRRRGGVRALRRGQRRRATRLIRRMTGGMSPVVLTGSTLTLDEVLAVARGGAKVEIDAVALDAMAAARAVVDRSIADGTPAYGVTTGVGSRKVFDVDADGHDRLLVRQHRISQGAPVAHEVVRAAALRLANALARATTGARPELASHLVAALNADRLPEIRRLGSIGQSDLAQMADLADGVLGDFELARGEAIALLNQSAFATGYAALAFADALVLLDVFDHAGALDLEALGANRNSVHPAIGEARPYPGLQSSLARLGALLEGSEVTARDLQDPLTFRTIAQQNGAARDALTFVGSQLAIELNAAQSNPLVVAAEDRVISVGNFEMQPLATALDIARLALAPMISTAAERAVKLLQRNLTGLSEGLGARPALVESALSEYGIAIQAIAVEARLLAQPVSFDLVSTTQAEGIEDRMTMAPLAARRLEEMVGLGVRVASIELMLAAQACDLRGATLGAGTARLRDSVRRFVPFLEEGASLPDLEPFVEEIRSGRLCA